MFDSYKIHKKQLKNSQIYWITISLIFYMHGKILAAKMFFLTFFILIVKDTGPYFIISGIF